MYIMKKEDIKEYKEQFIQKRVLEGKSFDTISKELGVSKPTLINWSKELEDEIINLENFEKEKLIEKYKVSKKARLESILELREKIQNEIKSRDLKETPFASLMKYLMDIEKLIDEGLDLRFYTGNTKSLIEADFTKKETLDFPNNLNLTL